MAEIENKQPAQESMPVVQTVDFYKLLPKRIDVAICSAKQILKIAVVFLAILLAFYFYQTWKKINLSNSVHVLQKQEQALDARIKLILSQYGVGGKQESFAQKVKNMQAEIKVKLQMVTILGGENAQDFKGFSGYLKEIAAVIPGAVWLNDIEIHRTSGWAVLKGYTYSNADLLYFVEKLNTSEIFKTFHFRLHTLGRQKSKEKKAMVFEIRTQEKAK